MFLEGTKHIEVDCHFVQDKILSGNVTTLLMKFEDQLADIFIKPYIGLFRVYMFQVGLI